MAKNDISTGACCVCLRAVKRMHRHEINLLWPTLRMCNASPAHNKNQEEAAANAKAKLNFRIASARGKWPPAR